MIVTLKIHRWGEEEEEEEVEEKRRPHLRFFFMFDDKQVYAGWVYILQ